MKRMLAKKTAKQANLHPVGNEEKKKKIHLEVVVQPVLVHTPLSYCFTLYKK